MYVSVGEIEKTLKLEKREESSKRKRIMPTNKKRQHLTLFLVSKSKDCFGVWEVCVLINGKEYTYPVSSEYAVVKVERLLRGPHPKYGKALHLLTLFKVNGFNAFANKEE
jgi:hypothetical protein